MNLRKIFSVFFIFIMYTNSLNCPIFSKDLLVNYIVAGDKKYITIGLPILDAGVNIKSLTVLKNQVVSLLGGGLLFKKEYTKDELEDNKKIGFYPTVFANRKERDIKGAINIGGQYTLGLYSKRINDDPETYWKASNLEDVDLPNTYLDLPADVFKKIVDAVETKKVLGLKLIDCSKFKDSFLSLVLSYPCSFNNPLQMKHVYLGSFLNTCAIDALGQTGQESLKEYYFQRPKISVKINESIENIGTKPANLAVEFLHFMSCVDDAAQNKDVQYIIARIPHHIIFSNGVEELSKVNRFGRQIGFNSIQEDKLRTDAPVFTYGLYTQLNYLPLLKSIKAPVFNKLSFYEHIGKSIYKWADNVSYLRSKTSVLTDIENKLNRLSKYVFNLNPIFPFEGSTGFDKSGKMALYDNYSCPTIIKGKIHSLPLIVKQPLPETMYNSEEFFSWFTESSVKDIKWMNIEVVTKNKTFKPQKMAYEVIKEGIGYDLVLEGLKKLEKNRWLAGGVYIDDEFKYILDLCKDGICTGIYTPIHVDLDNNLQLTHRPLFYITKDEVEASLYVPYLPPGMDMHGLVTRFISELVHPQIEISSNILTETDPEEIRFEYTLNEENSTSHSVPMSIGTITPQKFSTKEANIFLSDQIDNNNKCTTFSIEQYKEMLVETYLRPQLIEGIITLSERMANLFISIKAPTRVIEDVYYDGLFFERFIMPFLDAMSKIKAENGNITNILEYEEFIRRYNLIVSRDIHNKKPNYNKKYSYTPETGLRPSIIDDSSQPLEILKEPKVPDYSVYLASFPKDIKNFLNVVEYYLNGDYEYEATDATIETLLAKFNAINDKVPKEINDSMYNETFRDSYPQDSAPLASSSMLGAFLNIHTRPMPDYEAIPFSYNANSILHSLRGGQSVYKLYNCKVSRFIYDAISPILDEDYVQTGHMWTMPVDKYTGLSLEGRSFINAIKPDKKIHFDNLNIPLVTHVTNLYLYANIHGATQDTKFKKYLATQFIVDNNLVSSLNLDFKKAKEVCEYMLNDKDIVIDDYETYEPYFMGYAIYAYTFSKKYVKAVTDEFAHTQSQLKLDPEELSDILRAIRASVVNKELTEIKNKINSIQFLTSEEIDNTYTGIINELLKSMINTQKKDRINETFKGCIPTRSKLMFCDFELSSCLEVLDALKREIPTITELKQGLKKLEQFNNLDLEILHPYTSQFNFFYELENGFDKLNHFKTKAIEFCKTRLQLNEDLKKTSNFYKRLLNTLNETKSIHIGIINQVRSNPDFNNAPTPIFALTELGYSHLKSKIRDTIKQADKIYDNNKKSLNSILSKLEQKDEQDIFEVFQSMRINYKLELVTLKYHALNQVEDSTSSEPEADSTQPPLGLRLLRPNKNVVDAIDEIAKKAEKNAKIIKFKNRLNFVESILCGAKIDAPSNVVLKTYNTTRGIFGPYVFDNGALIEPVKKPTYDQKNLMIENLYLKLNSLHEQLDELKKLNTLEHGANTDISESFKNFLEQMKNTPIHQMSDLESLGDAFSTCIYDEFKTNPKSILCESTDISKIKQASGQAIKYISKKIEHIEKGIQLIVSDTFDPLYQMNMAAISKDLKELEEIIETVTIEDTSMEFGQQARIAKSVNVNEVDVVKKQVKTNLQLRNYDMLLSQYDTQIAKLSIQYYQNYNYINHRVKIRPSVELKVAKAIVEEVINELSFIDVFEKSESAMDCAQKIADELGGSTARPYVKFNQSIKEYTRQLILLNLRLIKDTISKPRHIENIFIVHSEEPTQAKFTVEAAKIYEIEQQVVDLVKPKLPPANKIYHETIDNKIRRDINKLTGIGIMALGLSIDEDAPVDEEYEQSI